MKEKKPSRVPLIFTHWWGEGLQQQYGERLKEFDIYPQDAIISFIDNPATPAKMGLSWKIDSVAAHDSQCVLNDWPKLDEFIEKLPNPEADKEFKNLEEIFEKAHKDNIYIMFGWWCLFFEEPWKLRGMANLLIDYYTEKENVHKLYSALCNVYCKYIKYAKKKLNPDGFWTSDDLVHQTGPMMNPKTFHEFMFPYYKKIGDTLKECDMHFWMHSCGDNTLLLPDLVDAGLTVFHPIQKHTIDEKAIAKKFCDKLTFLVGFDVQHTLQEKKPDDIKDEVRFLIDTFDRPNGGMCIAAGNGIVAGTPFENIRAFLDEAYKYGKLHREKYLK